MIKGTAVIALDAKSPFSDKTIKDKTYKIGVKNKDAPPISAVTNGAVEYGKTVFSMQLKTVKHKKISAYLTSDTKNDRV